MVHFSFNARITNMQIFPSVKLNDLITFRTYSDNIFGVSFTNVRIVAVYDADTAMAFVDIYSRHQSIYPFIPSSNGIANDPKLYSYVKVLLPNGEHEILGLPWIDETTVVKVDNRTLQLKFSFETNEQQENLFKVLTANKIPFSRVE